MAAAIFKMAKRQASILGFCLQFQNNSKAARKETDSELDDDENVNELETISNCHISSGIQNEDKDDDQCSASEEESNTQQADLEESSLEVQMGVEVRDSENLCGSPCCVNNTVAYQPIDKITLQQLTSNKRNFQAAWYKRYPWLSICLTKKKAFCLYCRYASKQKWITFSKTGEQQTAFTESGFQNWKKGIEKFNAHEGSRLHREAQHKWLAQQRPTIASQLSSQQKMLQTNRRNGLVMQLEALRFLNRQGLAIFGHQQQEGNFYQLMKVQGQRNEVCREWIKQNRYMHPEAVNEQISIMAQCILRELLATYKKVTGPPWFSVIADEATDICSTEQLNLSIRWVSDDYDIHEDSIAFFGVPDTKSETLYKVITDVLIRCNIPIELCRGQAYDGAANMQGRRTGVATRILAENPAAIPVHCLAHSLNLCLQGVGKSILQLRNALEAVREISNLIRFSPKRLTLFLSKLEQPEETTAVKLKPLCATRWTARTGAIEAVLKDYSVLLDLLEEIHLTTHDEYGLRANGILHTLERFETLFGLRLGYHLFGASENVSLTLQRKNISLQEALAAVKTAKSFYRRMRSHEEFIRFYTESVKIAKDLKIGEPVLQRQRRRPQRYEDGSLPHSHPTIEDHYRSIYYEACDLLSGELERRFENQHVPVVLSIEQTLIKAANNEDFRSDLDIFEKSCFGTDVKISDLTRQLPLLYDVIQKEIPTIKKVTSVQTICDALNTNCTYKSMFQAVHHFIRLFLTVPVTSSTSERSFSALRRLYTYLRSSMTQSRLNHCLTLHQHKDYTDNLNLIAVAKEFVERHDERIKYFGHF